ncbi:hypothetical protein [Streptomyces sp. NPDC059575]|uniref:hypothetical protein n=1 Tax=Streptomyces sp. NPDC059575 TaxID=3346872 RepID=UPI003677D478
MKPAIPRAEAVEFKDTPLVPRPEDVASDMGTLADRVRALADLTAGREIRVPLGGQFFDVVVTSSRRTNYLMINEMDEIQRSEADEGIPDPCGPVFQSPDHRALFWLVPPGTSRRWQLRRSLFAECYGAPYQLTLPPLDRTGPPGTYWRRPCRADRLVPAGPLQNLIAEFLPDPTPPLGRLKPVLSATP